MNNNSSAYIVKIFMKLTETARYYKNFLTNKISEVFNKIESKFLWHVRSAGHKIGGRICDVMMRLKYRVFFLCSPIVVVLVMCTFN